MIIEPSDFIRQVREAPAGRVNVDVNGGAIILQVTNGIDDEIRKQFSAEGPECIGWPLWEKFKQNLISVLAEPEVSVRVDLLYQTERGNQIIFKFKPAVSNVSGLACHIHVIQENETNAAEDFFDHGGVNPGDFVIKFDHESHAPFGQVYRAHMFGEFTILGA